MAKKKADPYFGEREEQAVIDYILTSSADVKNRLYNQILLEPFRKMIQSILRRYPIHIGNYEMWEVEAYALSHLIEHMIKYRPFIIEKRGEGEKWIKLNDTYRFIFVEDAEKKFKTLDPENYRIFSAKAYSYCQTIVRNYFKDHGKKTFNDKKINLSYDDYADEINQNRDYYYEMEGEDHNLLDNLINNVINSILEKINLAPNMKKNEVVVGEAIINVLENWNTLFMEDSPDGKYGKRVTNKFAKNKILLFLKEQTRLSTKEIRMAMKPFKEIYFLEKDGFLDD